MAPLRLNVLAVPFGGPNGGKDLDGEFFSPRTDTGLEDVGRIGLYWHHTKDTVTRRIGYAEGWRKASDGWWCDVVVDDARLAGPLRNMAEAGQLFASSGAVSHLVVREPGGHLSRWPVGELSLTGRPSNSLAVARLATVETAPADPQIAGTLDRLDQSIYGLQRLRRTPAQDRLQDAVWALRDSLAA
jgi:hypothetical protein